MSYYSETIRRFAVILVAPYIFLATSSVVAEEKSSPENGQKNNQEIQIIADQLISNSQDNFAEFIGHVEVTQESFVMKSDRLRIYYRTGKGNSKKPSAAEESIEKIIAEGNVKIWADDNEAETEQAEYSVADMVLVLSGENSKVISGKNYITGSKITLYRKDGRIKVEGRGTQRVKAIFYPEKKTTFKKNNHPPTESYPSATGN